MPVKVATLSMNQNEMKPYVSSLVRRSGTEGGVTPAPSQLTRFSLLVSRPMVSMTHPTPLASANTAEDSC